jgi:nicotinamidase-related amidase
VLQAAETLLLVIDVQEKLMQKAHEAEIIYGNILTLMRGANILRIPVVGTTQNAEKLGDVLPEIRKLLPPLLPPFDKMAFSCYANPALASEIQRSGRKQILICGLESHICVSQTAHDLMAAGLQVHVAADAVTARTEINWRLGLDKMRQAGVLLSSVEMALYEMLREAGTPEFRDVLKLVK